MSEFWHCIWQTLIQTTSLPWAESKPLLEVLILKSGTKQITMNICGPREKESLFWQIPNRWSQGKKTPAPHVSNWMMTEEENWNSNSQVLKDWDDALHYTPPPKMCHRSTELTTTVASERWSISQRLSCKWKSSKKGNKHVTFKDMEWMTKTSQRWLQHTHIYTHKSHTIQITDIDKSSK